MQKATHSNRYAIIIIGILFFVFGFVTWLNGPLWSSVQIRDNINTAKN